MSSPLPSSAAYLLVPMVCLSGCVELDEKPADIAQMDSAVRECTGACEPDAGAHECMPGTIVCDGNVAITCDEQGKASQRDCDRDDLVCAPRLGCSECFPGTARCDGDASRKCELDGSGYGEPEPCDGEAGLHCELDSGQCRDLCEVAQEVSSYLGCEYWPTVTNNPVDEEFSFAVVVSNPQVVTAHIEIARGGDVLVELEVAPGQVEQIELPWVEELKRRTLKSTLVRGGAYRLRSDVPVAAYQFSPLGYRIGQDCAEEDSTTADDGECFSYTNDASLLLPTHILGADYLTVTLPSLQEHERFVSMEGEPLFDTEGNYSEQSWSTRAGFVAIVGVEDEPVEVEIELGGDIQPASETDAELALAGLEAGDTVRVTLGTGDVLQLLSRVPESRGSCAGSPTLDIERTCGPDDDPFPCIFRTTFCKLGADYDLTGSRIRADGRVFVINGHECAYVPFTTRACDHLEEPAFPLQSWGTQYVVAKSQPVVDEPNMVRIVSGADGNRLSFAPEVLPPQTLGKGEVLDFLADRDFEVSGSGVLTVAQFMVGQEFATPYDPDATEAEGAGDPSMSFVAPVAQFRRQYAFLTPSTYEQSWITVVTTQPEVRLNGRMVAGFSELEGTPWHVARVRIAPGSHTMEADTPFGLTVYGFGAYTSYMYPAGLDFIPIYEVE